METGSTWICGSVSLGWAGRRGRCRILHDPGRIACQWLLVTGGGYRLPAMRSAENVGQGNGDRGRDSGYVAGVGLVLFLDDGEELPAPIQTPPAQHQKPCGQRQPSRGFGNDDGSIHGRVWLGEERSSIHKNVKHS
jgi:hypothetical protein